MSRILITGAAGFIGSHLSEALLRQGHQVVGLDNFDPFYEEAVKRLNLEAVQQHAGFQFVEGDIRDLETVRALVSDIDVVIHLAAKAGVRPSVQDPLGYEDTNIRGTSVMLEACKDRKNLRFVFGSSSSVYGNNAKVPFSEDDPIESLQSPYACTKRCCELLCQTYHSLYNLPITSLRFFTVYGPRQRPDLAIHKFVKMIENGEALTVYGDGSMKRDFTYVDDIVSGVIRAAETCDGLKTYNLGNSSPVSVMELIEHIEKATGKKANIEKIPQPLGEVRQTYANIDLASRDLGFSPKTQLTEGLANFVEWYREERAAV
ncbi:MAG: GDP-mannose 4,6-dehydratase [Phycisphaerae bacterium]